MAYTPVSERNVKVKPKYVPVAERVEKPSLQSFFPVKQQIQELSKPVTTRPMTLKEVMQQDITKLSQRDMSKDVIYSGKPEETSLLRKMIKSTPIYLGFEKNVFDPLAKVAKFIFPSKDDYLREAVEENPKLSMDEVSKRANELMLKDGFIDTGGGNMISPLDMVSGSGVMGTTKIVPGIKRAVRKILEASSEDTAKKIALELTPNVSTANKFVADILKAKTEQEAELVLNNIDKQISKPKYIPVKDRVAKVPEADAQIIDSAKESILSRFEEPVPIVTGKKQPNILGLDDKVKDDYLEFLKAEKAPTVQDINRGLELLRLDGKKVDDIATELNQIGKVPESKVDLVEEAKKFDNGADFYNYSTVDIRDDMQKIGIRGKEQFENWFNKNIKIGQKDYTMSHRPTETGATADNISQEVSDMGFPNDFYEHPEYYANLKDNSDIESWNVLKEIKGKPDREITIYRASPKNELNSGDWVTLSKSYAKQESLAEGTPVNSFKVRAKDIQFAGDSINEFGYYPKITTNTKLQAFKAGKPSPEGGYIANPFQGKPKQLVDNQGVSSVNDNIPKKPERVVIDAELKEIKQAVLNKETTENQIDELSNRLGIAESTLDASPAKGLVKYKSKTTGRLPEVTGKDTMKSLTGSGKVVKNSEFGIRGDDIITELGFKDVDDAQKALDNYLLQKENIKELRDLMRMQKASRALANKVGKVVRVATASRRHFVNELLDQFQLPESSVKSLIGGRDFRLMSQSEFDEFVVKLEQRAVEHFDKRQAKAELVDLLERRHFQKVENYRKSMQLPTVENMSAKQLREYADALEQFQTGDEFLTTRQLEVVDRGDLKGVKTFREAKIKLLEQIKKTKGMENITLDDLNVTPSALDNLSFDSALAERNPYYNFIVNRTQTHILNGEKHFIEVQNKVNDLAKKAGASRDRGMIGSIKQSLIPKYDEIVKYLEAPMDEKATFAKALTKEELDYANYIQQYYSQAYDHLVKIKELYGSRYVDQYFTHTRKQFLEEWSDNGIISAFKNWYSSYKQDEMVANILDQSTGEILPKSKFFQYTLQRTGGLEPSKNVTRVFLQYARTFERKKMFDEMIPELDIYTQSLTPKELTPRGLEMDRRLKTFVNKYLNTKKGRLENVGGVIKQNGPADMFLRMGNTFVSLYDLGLSIGASLASLIGEQVMTYQALGKIRYAKGWKNRIWDTGVKRLTDKNANKILKEAEPFIGRNIWTELAEADKGLGERAMQSIFGVFHQSSVEANKIFLLGSLSKEEIAKGVISPQKMAELRLEAGRWRDMGKDVKSILGATSPGQTFTKYKGWAIPIARTNIKNITELTKKISSGDFKGAITSREFAETYRAIEMSTVLVLVGSYVLSKEEEDTFIGRMKARAYQETMTLLGGTDPTVFLATPRLYSYLQQLGNNLKKLVLLEENEEGELKGVKGLQRQATPAVIRQFENKETEEDKSMLPELPKLPTPKLPKLPTLP